jgi:hypothetical protein
MISYSHAIDSGGSGCVFKPPLTCKDNSYNKNGISKLMFNDDAMKEFKLINKINEIVEKIPKNENYFLVSNVNFCKPDELNEHELNSFDKMCKGFTEKKYNKTNLNTKMTNIQKEMSEYIKRISNENVK